MQSASVIPFPKTSVADSAKTDHAETSVLELVANLVEDYEIRNQIRREYVTYFTSTPSLVRHWLSILDEHGQEETNRRLRRIVSQFIMLKTEDERTAQAYHANCGKLFNAFIDDLTSHLLQAIEAARTVKV